MGTRRHRWCLAETSARMDSHRLDCRGGWQLGRRPLPIPDGLDTAAALVLLDVHPKCGARRPWIPRGAVPAPEPRRVAYDTPGARQRTRGRPASFGRGRVRAVRTRKAG